MKNLKKKWRKKTRFQIWLNPLFKSIWNIAKNLISKLFPNIPMKTLIKNEEKKLDFEFD